MIGIYKVINPSGKIYIGQSINIEERWKCHKYGTGLGLKMTRSYKKYGYENHIFEIIEECISDKLDERELYWINFYNTVKKGLNGTACVQGGYHSEETKNKISEGQKGRKGCWEGKKRPDHSKFMIEYFKNNPVKLSDSTKKLISDKSLNMVICKDKRTGEIFKIHKNIYDSSDNLVGITNNIECKKRRKLINCIELNDVTDGINETLKKYQISTCLLYKSIKTGCKILINKYPNLGGITFQLISK